MNDTPSGQANGLLFALAAYFIWGVLPLYLHLIDHVPPFEFVGWRILFTLPVCIALIAWRKQVTQLRAALGNPRVLKLLTASSLLIGANWLIYTAAIQSGHFFAASLGYYINPLVNVLAGTAFLGEKLTRRQWIAVGIAAIAVSLLAWDAREMLWISLSLAFSFAGYGLVRKFAPVAPLPGLTIEAVILVLPALAIVAFFAQTPAGMSVGQDAATNWLVACSGVGTATPLLLFATAAQRMSYSALGFVQYEAPTLVFLIGLFVFDEALRPVQLACFLLIWAAIAIYSWDIWSRRNREAAA